MAAQPPTPLDSLLVEIDTACNNGLCQLALAMTFALPDICVSLSSQDGRSTGARYVEWCKDNLDDRFSFVTGEDLYSMRCGVLHNGRFGELKHGVARVLFAPPNANGHIFVNNLINDAYFYGAVEFCRNFADAVRTWYGKNANDPTVKANLPRMMQYHPNGIPPYVVGTTVLG
tara:strand:- start:1125 stop:1643 length:519 start_codon:yes stop_codon:yes gene_type:complete